MQLMLFSFNLTKKKMHSSNNPLAAENEQRMISIARTAIRSSLNLPAQSSSVEDLSEEAEKMLRRV